MAVFTPATNKIHAMRLKVGDIHDVPYFEDQTYQDYLTINNGNVNRASVDIAFAILGKLSRNTREKFSIIEVYGNDYFNNYSAFLKQFILDPRYSFEIAMPYAGGISRSDMQLNVSNTDTNTAPLMEFNSVVEPDAPLFTSKNGLPYATF